MGFRNGDGQDTPDKEVVDLSPGDETETKVNLEDAEDDNDKDDGEREEKAASRERDDDKPRKKDGTWAARKAERGKDRKAAKTWETERAEYDRRIARMQEDSDRNNRQLREELDRIRTQSQRGQDQDPHAAALSDVERQIEQELALIEQDPNRGYKHYNHLRRQEQKIVMQQVIGEHSAKQQQNQPIRTPYDVRIPIIESEYPWTADRQYADLSRKAMAYRNYLIQVEGRADTIETDREALSFIQAKHGGEYGLRAPPAAPSARTRSMYAPPPSRGTPDRRPIPREVNLGAMGQGTGLSPEKLARSVRDALVGDD
jgi:hypothetical protein